MIDKYFTYAILVDIFIASLITGICCWLVAICLLPIPNSDFLFSTTSDIANVAFTSAGFVLTFLTLFVSFKASAKPIKKKKKETRESAYKVVSLFELFLHSELYLETIRHLKNGVKELILIALLGYSLKLLIGSVFIDFLFYYDIFGLIIISMTLWRSLLILTGVLKIEKREKEQTKSI
ncbi:hypothetical protein [Arenibacter sp. F20364]|uniref:hypothetical protein n=1 Tax=Arenibacter sp. F20364 TaxID=2926415 RepID=UPI001FF1231A|nr:hypothetical protein [Arenibacter sp. F20364]MCK0190666.1 hypothetical protein [Arenibacter sp. F20364]